MQGGEEGKSTCDAVRTETSADPMWSLGPGEALSAHVLHKEVRVPSPGEEGGHQ